MDKSGLGTANQIMEILSKTSLNTDNLAFQSYNCVSNILSQFNGAEAKLSKLVSHNVLYIPCQAQCFPCLEHACNASVIISNMIVFLKRLYVFSQQVINGIKF